MRTLHLVEKGDRLAASEIYKSTKVNTWVYYLFLLIFGFFGVHKFYMANKVADKRGMYVLVGIAYIFTFGFMGFGVILDMLFGWLSINSINEDIEKDVVTMFS